MTPRSPTSPRSRRGRLCAGITGIVAIAAVGLLSGCSGNPVREPASSTAEAPSTGSTTNAAEGSGPAQTSSEAPSDAPSETTPEVPSKTESPQASGTTSTAAPSAKPRPTATGIRYVWPDSTWTVNSGGEATCDGMGPDASQFTDLPGYFTCGPTASSLVACAADGQNGSAMCIQNLDSKLAARMKDPSTAGYSGAPTSSPVPLRVGLDHGVTCSIVSHDHDTHWNDWFSWYPCSDGSELLVSNIEAGTDGTFDRSGATWTVQVSRNKQKPDRQPVQWAEYAGKK